MSFFLMIYRSLRQHAFSTLFTAGSIALASGLLMTVWVVKEQSQRSFTEVSTGFDAVLGARGSKLQLVLNALFHLESSPGNISEEDYAQIKGHPAIARAVPIAVGDNYRGYRLVGTIPELFLDVELSPGRKFSFARGRVFEPQEKEAVVGSFAAQRLGLKVGDTFHPYHGLIFDERSQHAETYTVAGILAPSNTPADRVLWIPIKGLQTMSGHDPRAASDVSAVLLQLRSPAAAFQLDMLYNRRGNRLTFAWPVGTILADLFNKISWFDRVLGLVAYLVVLIATGSVLVSIYNSMNARRRDIAILRALGARRKQIFASVTAEAAATGVLGVLFGYILYGILTSAVAAIIRAETGVVLDPWAWHPVLFWAPAAVIGLCGVAGMIPAGKAYRTPVAETLAPIS